MAISGSFVRGNWAGPALGPTTAINDRSADASLTMSLLAINDRTSDSSTITSSLAFRERGIGEQKIVGYYQGISFEAPTTLDGAGSFGRHMQVGVNRENTDGSPSPPSLRLDLPGSFWRFRWVLKTGNRTLTVAAKQNSTGSLYRPSVVIKKNLNIGLVADLSASAANGNDWVTVGPINFTVSGSDVVWVELHNNNQAWTMRTNDGVLMYAPAYFDHIVTT